jgi:hypothetical protein
VKVKARMTRHTNWNSLVAFLIEGCMTNVGFRITSLISMYLLDSLAVCDQAIPPLQQSHQLLFFSRKFGFCVKEIIVNFMSANYFASFFRPTKKVIMEDKATQTEQPAPTLSPYWLRFAVQFDHLYWI